MRYLTVSVVLFGALAIAAFAGQAPQQPPQQPPQPQTQQPAPTADPYANNAAPGATQFPLAAAAGKDSNARNVAPAGAMNTGPFDPTTWKNGHAFDPPAGSKIWNPVKLKMMRGEKVTGGTLFSGTDPATNLREAHRGRDLLRDGQRRLRLHLDGDAAQRSRLGGGGADVAHVPVREGGPRRPRRLHRRARDPARARRRRARRRRADHRLEAGGDRGAQLD